MKSLLTKLQLEPVNAGACHGPDAWIRDPKASEFCGAPASLVGLGLQQPEQGAPGEQVGADQPDGGVRLHHRHG